MHPLRRLSRARGSALHRTSCLDGAEGQSEVAVAGARSLVRSGAGGAVGRGGVAALIRNALLIAVGRNGVLAAGDLARELVLHVAITAQVIGAIGVAASRGGEVARRGGRVGPATGDVARVILLGIGGVASGGGA